MKNRNYLFSLFFLFVGFMTYSQKESSKPACLSQAIMDNLIKENPDVKMRLDAMDIEIGQQTEGSIRKTTTIPNPIITIPVVVYVVHDPANPASNISDDRVNSQLAALNTYFSPYDIRFCLATKAGAGAIPTPSGGTQSTTGIIHLADNALSNHSSATEMLNLVNMAGSSIIKDRYLRIWVVNSIDAPSTIAGYSMFPNSSTVFDGIVMRYDVFGNEGDPLCACTNTMYSGYELGKILVHEVGHYLGLYHTFHESCSGMTAATCNLEGDRICDTPPVNAPNYNCTAGINSCNETYNGGLPDNIQNYMDYGDNGCLNQFTPEQKARMFYMLNTYRSTLFSADNILYTQTCGYQTFVSANFTPSTYSPCHNVAVTFNAPIDAATTYTWDFGDGGTGSGQSVSHPFAASATPYTVTLTAYKASAGTTMSTAQIYSTVCNVINSEDSNWYTAFSNALRFNSGVALYATSANFPTPLTTQDVSVCESNSSGAMLFYANQFKAYRASNHTAINTTDLLPYTAHTRSMVSVPSPTTPGHYYLFYNSYNIYETIGTAQGFRYSILNTAGSMNMVTHRAPIAQPSGTGYSTATDGAVLGGSGVAAIRRCANRYWILTVNIKSGVPNLSVYTLDPNVAAPQFVSEAPLTGISANSVYNIEVAPNGNKILIYRPTSDLNYVFDFDKITGGLSNPQQIFTGTYTFGATFSPDSNLLYIAHSTNRRIYQFNLNAPNLNASRREVGSHVNNSFGNMEIGPDGKIYIITTTGQETSVIHNPNALATFAEPNACQFSIHGPLKESAFGSGRALPNTIDADLATSYPTPPASPTTPSNLISAYRTGCSSYKFFSNICNTAFVWRFTNVGTGSFVTITGNNTPVYSFPASGTYSVTTRSSANQNTILATYPNITITTLPAPTILGSSTACTTVAINSATNNSVVLAAGQTAVWTASGGTISGPNNAGDVTVVWASLPGTLSVTVTDAAGCSASNTRTITSVCACDCLNGITFTASSSFGNQVTFNVVNPNTANQLCGSIYPMYYWDFGDGTSAYGGQTSRRKTYSTSGTYPVTLNARILGEYDQILCSTSYTANVTATGGIIGPIDDLRMTSSTDKTDAVVAYPNPASSNMNLAITMEKTGPVHLIVRSIDGKLLSEFSWNLEKGRQTVTFDLPEHLANGMILLDVNSDEFNVVEKVIISK